MSPSNSIWDKRVLPSLSLSYSGQTVNFTHFANDQLPLVTVGQASLEFTQLGLGYATGPARTQRKIWTVSAYVSPEQWRSLRALFEEWDAARATGSNQALINVVDNILMPENVYYSGKAFFTDNPTLTKVSPGNNTIFVADFSLTEV